MLSLAELRSRHQAFRQMGLKLDLTRGKPSAEVVGFADSMEHHPGQDFECDGIDTRNYGTPLGLPSMRAWFAELLGVPDSWVLVGGNSSLELMYQGVQRGWQMGYAEQLPWREGTARFLCPVPGYDRHFSICEQFGIEMLPVALTGAGPDMDEVERLVDTDSNIRGIWCVPRHSNPSGETYSPETVMRLAQLPKRASADFRIFWDNAYIVHDLADEAAQQASPNLPAALEQTGTQESALMFTSLSKITRSGSGVACLAAAEGTLAAIMQLRSAMTIGGDKVNQLRHLRFFQQQPLRQVMQSHAHHLRPRFELTLKYLEQLEPETQCHYTRPSGGYFVSFYAKPGTAQKVHRLCADAGVSLTPPGAAYPYGNDPNDSHIRLAPTYPSLAELDQAMQVFVNSVRLAVLD